MSVQILSDQLKQLGFQAKTEAFRSRAYYKAATIIADMNDDDFEKKSDFSDIRGIGSSINEKIKIYKTTGFLPGITAATKINNGMIKERVGFNTTRIPLYQALAIIDSKLEVIKKETEFVGSIRREKPFIADIDALVEKANYIDVVDYLKDEFRLLVQGESKTSFIVDEENLIQLDINCYAKADKAFAMLHHTGSKEHNIYLRSRAMKMDLTLNQYGLFRKDGTKIDCKTEEEIFQALRVLYAEPKNRK